MKQYVDHIMKVNTSAMKAEMKANTAAIEVTNVEMKQFVDTTGAMKAEIEANTAAIEVANTRLANIEAMLSALVNK